ncbi:cell wall-binding repeat-containing protein [Glaciibacter psychrotolerans]|uniref:cell wall-binding repeat-containing protein n=1 Tax=Glaciibacter psychrotolerans TaxID=670054 RepID=UPI0031B6173B
MIAELKTLAPSVVRISGADRFETARKVVDNAFPGTVASTYVATGLNFPDALSAAAAAGSLSVPVVLVNGSATSADAATQKLLTRLKPSTLRIVGGNSAVSAGVASSLKKFGTVTRYSGANRFETSQQVNKSAIQKATGVFFATGFQFPDALAGAVVVGARKSPLYVVQPGCVPASITADLVAYEVDAVTLIGGAGALSDEVGKLAGCSVRGIRSQGAGET